MHGVTAVSPLRHKLLVELFKGGFQEGRDVSSRHLSAQNLPKECKAQGDMTDQRL